ncbi:17696_t:CDS:1, partial [Acaulospora morrowiae]
GHFLINKDILIQINFIQINIIYTMTKKINEIDKQREARLKREREQKCQKRSEETFKQRETRLVRMHERKKERISNENSEEYEMRLTCEREHRRKSRVQVLTQRRMNIQHKEAAT